MPPLLNHEEIERYISKNYEGKSIRPVTIDLAKKNILALQDQYRTLLYGPKYEECFQDMLHSEKYSFETRKSRIVNFLRLVRAMTRSEFANHFHRSLSQLDVVDTIRDKVSELNQMMKDEINRKAKEGTIDEKYIPWTFIYNQAKEFVENEELSGKLMLQYRILAHLLILDHPPRRNQDYVVLQFPIEGETQEETRQRALEENLNIWNHDKLFLNDYKTKGHYGEYIMELKPGVVKMLEELWEGDFELIEGGGGKKKPVSRDLIFPKIKIPEALKTIIGTFATVNTLRHSFLTYYYGHKHGQPIYLHEKNQMASMMAHSVNTQEKYVIRNAPLKEDKMRYYEDIVATRNTNVSDTDKSIIDKLTETEVIEEVTKKTGPRRQSPIVREVLESYKHLFVGKSMDEKRAEKPYLKLSQCEDLFRNGMKVKDILGDDVQLIRKWCSKLR